jgi:phenylacetate-CoA ligase
VRFGTGDLSAWIPGPDGRPRLAGVLGRVGAAVKVRGMFLHPRQIEAAMRDLDAVASYRFVVDRAEHRDELRCEVVPAADVDEARLIQDVRTRVRSALRFDARVVAVPELSGEQNVIVDNRSW